MNFGAFAGGFSGGFNNGVQMGKTMRDILKDRKLQDLREQGMAEAEAQRVRSAQELIKDNGLPSDAPTSGPVDKSTPKVEAPQESAATPVPPPTAVEARELPPPSATPASAAQATPSAPSVSTQTPATQTPQPVDPAPVQATPAQVSQAKPNPQAVVAGGMLGKRFTVNGVGYETREQAQAAAERAAPSTMDLFMKNTVPKLAAQYVVNGEPEKAKAWTDYAESANGKRAIKDWASAYTAPDFDTAASRFGKYYTEHINDGVDYTGHKLLTKQDGTQVAVVTLKDKASGKTMEMEMTRERMLAMGAANNPQKLFETEQARQTSAEKMKFEAGLKAQERAAKREDDIYMEGVKSKSAMKKEEFTQDRLDQREGIKSDREVVRENAKVNAKIDAQVASLRDAGYSDDDIKTMMPALVGAGAHKKTTDPTERRALIASDILKNDPRFARLTASEQNKRVDDMMSVIYRDDKTTVKPTSAQPGIASKPISYNPQYKVVYQRGTGKPFHVVDGQYVPIDGAVPPQANGMPKK